MKKIDMFLENLITNRGKRFIIFGLTYYLIATFTAFFTFLAIPTLASDTPMDINDGTQLIVIALGISIQAGWFFFPGRFGWPIITLLLKEPIFGESEGAGLFFPFGCTMYLILFLIFMATKNVSKAKIIFYVFVGLLILNMSGCLAMTVD